MIVSFVMFRPARRIVVIMFFLALAHFMLFPNECGLCGHKFILLFSPRQRAIIEYDPRQAEQQTL